MAHFYGTLQGRGTTESTCCGTKSSGVEATVASYKGAVKTEVYHREDLGQDWVSVHMVEWEGKGVYFLIYDGPVGRFEPSDYVKHQWKCRMKE